MQNNFISKTIKTFLTSLVISVFVFGSFYFLLSDGSESSKPSSDSNARKDSNTKFVMEEEAPANNKLENSSIDIKKEVLGVTTDSSSSSQAQTSQTGGMLAQISDNYDEPVQTTPVFQITAPSVTTTTVPAVTYNGTTTATGVPTTGNEGLYILMAAFSLISGFLITNGKDLAMKNFEK